MPDVSRSATFVLSVDVDPRTSPRDLAGRHTLDEAADQLLARLSGVDLPATWAIAELTGLPTAERIAATDGHELALLGDRSWTGETIGRGGFSTELNRRRESWTVLGVTPTTLALADGTLGIAAEFVSRSGFSAVRPSASSRTGKSRGLLAKLRNLWGDSGVQPAMAAPRALRWGLWELQPSCDLLQVGARATQRALDRAIAATEPVHIMLDLQRLAFAGRGSWGPVDRLLRHVARRRDEGLLQASSIAGLVATVQGSLQGRPARSILRQRAA
jgi:hypothetical protein